MLEDPTNDYCTQFGFDAVWREERLALLDFRASDERLASRLQTEVIEPEIDRIVANFYRRLLENREAVALLEQHDVEKLKATQRDYILSFGRNVHEKDYFERRLRVGLVHAWVGVPLGLYQCSMHLLQQCVVGAIHDRIESAAIVSAMESLVCKVAALDASLASETYHQVQVRGLQRSMDSLRNEQHRLRRRIETDPLTGVSNREPALELLSEELPSALAEGRPLCVVMADLDHFKRVNDEYGHLAGDRVLLDVASRMQSALREFDLVGRYGGEEFLLILFNTAVPQGREIAERVRNRVASTPIHAHEITIAVTLSQGLAQAQPGDTVDSLLERADKALYRAKGNGRNRVEVADA